MSLRHVLRVCSLQGFILAGAAGGRIGETLGLELHKHFSSDYRTIAIGQKVRHCRVEERVKSASAERQVDLDPRVADLLREFIGNRRHGFLFESRNGRPLSSSNIIRRHLHPALKALGYINPYTGDHKAGDHAFRRFRDTYLRNETSFPKGLRDYPPCTSLKHSPNPELPYQKARALLRSTALCLTNTALTSAEVTRRPYPTQQKKRRHTYRTFR